MLYYYRLYVNVMPPKIQNDREMVTRSLPWKGIDPLEIAIAVSQNQMRLQIPDDCDPVLKSIMLSVWLDDPHQR